MENNTKFSAVERFDKWTTHAEEDECRWCGRPVEQFNHILCHVCKREMMKEMTD